MKVGYCVLLLLVLTCSDAFSAVTVYLKNGSEIQAQAAWRLGNTVYVQLRPSYELEFTPSEVDLLKSKITVGKPKQSSMKVLEPANSKQMQTTAKVSEPADSKQQQSVAKSREVKAAVPAGYSTPLDELVEISGIRRDLIDYFGRSDLGEIQQIFSEAVSSELAEKIMKKRFEERLNPSAVEEVLKWYRTPVGKKLVEAESIVVLNRKANVRNFISLGKGPEFKKRLSLIGQIEKTTGAVELDERLMKYMLDKMTKAVPPDHPDRNQLKEQIMSELFEPGELKQKYIENFAYTYRNLTYDELQDYLQFLRSANGKKFTSAVLLANEEIFKKVAIKIAKYFVEALTM